MVTFCNFKSFKNLQPIAYSDLIDKIFKLYDKRSGKYIQIIKRIISTPEVLLRAYNNIIIKTFDQTAEGSVKLSFFNKINLNWFNSISKEICKGTYFFKPLRKIKIKNKENSLFLINFQDKILQEAIRMTLEIIYEPLFFDFPQGFQTTLNISTALLYIKNK